MKKITKEKILYLEILRIIACYFVIVNHSTILIFPNSNAAWVLYYARFVICKTAVPIFFMISGYLLLRKDYSYKDLLKKIFYIFVPLLICSVIAYIRYFEDRSFLGFILAFLENPVNSVYWYLYVLIGLYLVTPFLRKMIKSMDDRDFKIFILIMLLIPGVIPLIKYLFGISISSFLTQVMFNSAIGYFVLGYYLGNKDITKKESVLSYIFTAISSIFSVFLLFNNYQKTGVNSLFLDNSSLITTIVPAIGIFIIIKNYIVNRKKEIKLSSLIKTVSACTFGIYLFHMLVMFDLSKIEFMTKIFSINTFLGVLILDIILFIGLGFITYILKKIPVIKEFL